MGKKPTLQWEKIHYYRGKTAYVWNQRCSFHYDYRIWQPKHICLGHDATRDATKGKRRGTTKKELLMSLLEVTLWDGIPNERA